MTKRIITLIGFIFCFFSLLAQNDILKRIQSSVEMTPFTSGYVDSSGDTIIPIGKYTYCFTENFEKLAIVSKKGYSSFIAIDRKEKVLFNVMSYDNSPDPIRNGLFRIEVDGKIGYANMNGETIISPKFDFALPFKDGYAKICFGGREVKSGEHFRIIEGKWGVINKYGETLIKPIYDNIRLLKQGKAEVQMDDEWIEVIF